MEKCNTEELYLLHRQRLLSLIQSKVEDAQKAEDLLHDSFVKLETCCTNGCECEKPRSYLFRTALNIVFDYIKRRKKQSIRFSNDPITAIQKTKDQNVDYCDIIPCITSLLDETSEENREAFKQVDLFQIPQVQVAKEMGIPLPTLKSRVQRTRKYLSTRLTECCPEYQENCL